MNRIRWGGWLVVVALITVLQEEAVSRVETARPATVALPAAAA